jgi:hypothetical protein
MKSSSVALLKPLDKAQVFSLGHFDDDRLARWQAMKRERDERFAREDKRQARADMMVTLGRVVNAGERYARTRQANTKCILIYVLQLPIVT